MRGLRALFVVIAVIIAGCGTGGGAAGVIPVVVPAPIPIPIPIPIPSAAFAEHPLDGTWVLSDVAGGRSCLVIQESRVSILDLTCGGDGSGLVSRIIEAPRLTGGGSVIVLSIRYNPRSFDESEFSLVFSGEKQPDGAFVGTRRDEDLSDPFSAVETLAVLSRQ